MSELAAAAAVYETGLTTLEIKSVNPKEPSETLGQIEGSHRVWATERPSTVRAGVWSCSPGSFPSRRDGWSESFYVIAGRATITGDDGVVNEVSVGDMLVLPDGWTGHWQVHEPMRKVYTMMTHVGA